MFNGKIMENPLFLWAIFNSYVKLPEAMILNVSLTLNVPSEFHLYLYRSLLFRCLTSMIYPFQMVIFHRLRRYRSAGVKALKAHGSVNQVMGL